MSTFGRVLDYNHMKLHRAFDRTATRLILEDILDAAHFIFVSDALSAIASLISWVRSGNNQRSQLAKISHRCGYGSTGDGWPDCKRLIMTLKPNRECRVLRSGE